MQKSRLILAAVALSLALVGCKKDKKSDAKSDPAAAQAPADPSFSQKKVAFGMGRKYGYTCAFTMLNKPAEAKETLATANTYGKGLGLAPVSAPSEADAIKAMRSQDIPGKIGAKHGPAVKAAYQLGITLNDASLGAALKTDISTQLRDVRTYALAAGVPEALWKSTLDTVTASPTSDNNKALQRVFETHFVYAG